MAPGHYSRSSCGGEDDSFETINIANALHCFPDIDGALAETLRVAKPAGTIAINVLLYPRTHWPFDAISRPVDEWGMGKGILYTPLFAGRHTAPNRQRWLRAGFGTSVRKLLWSDSSQALAVPDLMVLDP